MTANRDFTDITRAWLDLMPSEAPDRAVASILQAVDATPQAKRRLAGPWRFSPMTRFALVGAAAVAVVAGALFLYPRLSANVGPPSISPSPSGPTNPSGAPSDIDGALRATWRAFAQENATLGTGAGPVTLEFSLAGNGVAASNFGSGNDYPSTVTPIAADRFEVVLANQSASCSAGDRGTYLWQLSTDRSHLTLTAEAEDCPNRGIVFQRQWVRSLVGATTVGAGIVDSMSPAIAVTLPDYSYQPRTLDDFAEIASPEGNGFSLLVFKNPQTFVDPCSTDEVRNPFDPSADAFFQHFQTTDAFRVGEVTELQIDGHRALHADVTGKADNAGCSQQLYQYTPQACNCHFIVGQGDSDSMYLVEVDGDTFLFIVSPFNSSFEQSVIESIRIPYDLPGL